MEKRTAEQTKQLANADRVQKTHLEIRVTHHDATVTPAPALYFRTEEGAMGEQTCVFKSFKQIHEYFTSTEFLLQPLCNPRKKCVCARARECICVCFRVCVWGGVHVHTDTLLLASSLFQSSYRTLQSSILVGALK